MWLEYASLVNDPGDIYSYLMSKGIGQTLALFYEEYANCLEENQKYKEVIRVYEQGIEQHAEPIKRLERSYNVFKKRMEARQTQGTPREREREARIQMDALRATGHRTMLGEKFDSRSRVSLHPNQFASIQQQSGSSSSSNSSFRARRTDLFGNSSGGESNLPAGPSFQVYTDTSSSLDQIPTTSLSTPLPSLGLSASQGIENERIKEKFAGATLPQADPVIIRPITKFQVYQDEADSESTIHKKKEAIKPLLHVSDGSESSLSRIRRYPILSDDDSTTQSIKIHKKAKPEDRTYEKLVRRFTKNGSDYVRTTDSKEKSEYICILNTFTRVHRFEPIMKEEYTEESLAAMKSINAILYTEKTEDEDEIEKDLTWTRDIQHEEEDVILNAFSNMSWAYDSSKSEAFVEETKNDFKEFVQVLAEDTEMEQSDSSTEDMRESLDSINTLSFSSLKDGLLKALEQQIPNQVQSVRLPENMNLSQLKEGLSKGTRSAEHYLQMFGTEVILALKNTVTVIAPEEQEQVAANHPRIFATRKEALLAKMQINEDTYLKEPEIEEAKIFNDNFRIDDQTERIAELLNTYPELREMMNRLVPVQVSYPLFWQRYFYQTYKIDQDEQKRQLIVQGVKDEQEDENEFKWDSDDEENITVKEEDNKTNSEDTDFSHLSEPSSSPQQQTTEDEWVKTEKKKEKTDDEDDSDWE
ncbi:hypothetical protein RO3G_11904 [Rhizopus delemar RA 99-880]|uniref:BSD domain-containing protein n=1 Tax=Rhizopus delemar (strain RA 99-880 / ATCC MYA-4621 / FGSC 9543 / NRRL 43880) TaxID=246409 RepID=I1CFG3_RHIO9|nr:hypothetical protein RO3G_11904 [Rhizopus delemar RA 99-880]|eukprot:EIE87193.1 hypothetical protein RO3G_11904 [Rhizopus delemar RA 99-880]